LEEVSTVRGSGWVDDQYAKLRMILNPDGRPTRYRVANGTTWKNAASDGKDLGADVDGVEGATANSPTGNWPSP
jgi:hypothetical protein